VQALGSASASPIAVMTTTTDAAAPRPTMIDGLNKNELAGRAAAAVIRRDGSTCLRDFDAHDKLEERPEFLTTDPRSAYANARAICLMLRGDCEGGKALYRRWLVQGNPPSMAASIIDSTVEGVAGEQCEGPNLSQRDQLIRANARLSNMHFGYQKANAAACKENYATVKRLSAVVKPTSERDGLVRFSSSTLDMLGGCIARTGDCTEAFRLYRDEWIARNKRPDDVDEKTHEQSMRAAYAFAVVQTACRGNP
jgi:hypothetical protein